MREHADPILAALLKRLREERGIKQEQLAFNASLTASALSRIERGITSPAWVTVVRIAVALDVGLVEIAATLERSRAPSTETPADATGGDEAVGPVVV